MATLIVRSVDEGIVELLKDRARRHGRSAEAEHRAILEAALRHTVPSAQEMLAFFQEGGALGLADVDLEQVSRGGPVVPADLTDER